MRGRPFAKGNAGKPKGRPNKATRDVRECARELVGNADYRRNLADRLKRGRCAPPMEITLWHYAYGKPKDTVKLEGELGVRQDLSRLTDEQLEQLALLLASADVGGRAAGTLPEEAG